MHPALLSPDELLKQCELRSLRRSGPGGQHRNKVETAIVVTHLPSGIEGQASERRSQSENRSLAIHRLRLNLAVQFRSVETSDEELTILEVRVIKGRVALSQSHANYPACLAVLLDHLKQDTWDLQPIANQLGTTSSQLVKLMRKHSPALTYFNAERAIIGLAPLQ